HLEAERIQHGQQHEVAHTERVRLTATVQTLRTELTAAHEQLSLPSAPSTGWMPATEHGRMDSQSLPFSTAHKAEPAPWEATELEPVRIAEHTWPATGYDSYELHMPTGPTAVGHGDLCVLVIPEHHQRWRTPPTGSMAIPEQRSTLTSQQAAPHGELAPLKENHLSEAESGGPGLAARDQKRAARGLLQAILPAGRGKHRG
ncbi:hypothetical protein ACFW9L_16410, partial [Streptomyces sp. NPDC059517]|uniref:hypothetical protein n=1 Tax=Streptomyces sp. NPDC059517 TaxID=3346855 RepID=UPI0036B52BE6